MRLVEFFQNSRMTVEHYATPRGSVELELRPSGSIPAFPKSSVLLPALPLMFHADSGFQISGEVFQISFDPYDSVLCNRVTFPSELVSFVSSCVPSPLRRNSVRSKYMNRLKVQHSAIWKSTRDLSSIPELHTESDWTFTTTYWGRIEVGNRNASTVQAESSQCVDDFFPMDKLRDTSRVIKVFKEQLLWEDELDDNGHAQFKVRYRLMEDFLFILATFELRVDGVLSSRALETRIYVDLSGPPTEPTIILREFKWVEAGVSIPELWTQETIRIE